MQEMPPLPNVASPQQDRGPNWVQRQWRRLRPGAQQTWLNLKIWVPFLQNPADRARMATFLARERRNGLEWEVILPPQCWSCGVTEGLRDREYEKPVRSFEFPLPIAGLGGASVLFFLMIAWMFFSWKALVLALVAAAIALGALLVKSWSETVRVRMSTCPEHAREMKFPECVVDQGELTLFLPNARLAQATVAAAKAERLKQQGYTPFSGGTAAAADTQSSADDHDESDRPRYRPPPPPKPRDLPPIKLEGDD